MFLLRLPRNLPHLHKAPGKWSEDRMGKSAIDFASTKSSRAVSDLAGAIRLLNVIDSRTS